jgi:uncharacterized protein (TIGR02145 family)
MIILGGGEMIIIKHTMLLAAILLFSCTEVQRDNPFDEKGINYNGGVSSSSKPSSSSSYVAVSSSSSKPSSSSISSSSEKSLIVYGPTVTYEGETYKSVVIGTQTWMAKNLNYAAPGSLCYDKDPANCDTYGRLYNWATAMDLPEICNDHFCAGEDFEYSDEYEIFNLYDPFEFRQGICPDGWHLPSVEEWEALVNFVGYENAGTILKANSRLWKVDSYSPKGTDDYGFAALPGGHIDPDAYCSPGAYCGDVGEYGYWWTATGRKRWGGNRYYRPQAHHWSMTSRYSTVHESYDNHSRSTLFSVRCIQDY